MRTPSERMLALLSLLQDGRDRTGAELAAHLGAAPRTVRRDLDRLRELGYPVESRRGPGGRYRLVAGRAMPPLLLSDDEAVAAVVALRMLAGAPEPDRGNGGDGGEGDDGPAHGALGKLLTVLPARLRTRLHAVTSSLDAGGRPAPAPPLAALRALGSAVTSRSEVRFTYVDRAGQGSTRRVEPARQVMLGRRWYLLGWDRDRDDWRTFRLDRVADLEVPGTTFAPRALPDDPVSFVQASVRAAGRPHDGAGARVRFAAAATDVAARLAPEAGSLEVVDDGHCRFVSGPERWDWLAAMIARVGVPYVVEGPVELVDATRALAERARRACEPG